MSGILRGLRNLFYRLFGPRFTAPILTADIVPPMPDANVIDEPMSGGPSRSTDSPRRPEVVLTYDGTASPTTSVSSHPPVRLGDDPDREVRPLAGQIDMARGTARPEADPAPGRPRNLRLGAPLGHGGGQGTVHALLGDSGHAYKRYHRPMPDAARAYLDLVAAGQVVLPMLDRYGIVAVWPEEVCGYSTTVEGYVMKRITPEFRIELLTPYGRKNELATLDHALPRSAGSRFRPAMEATAEDRLELVRAVGRFLDILHRHDLVYGDLSFKNVLFALNPARVLFMDIDSVRRLSAPIVPEKDLVNTPDWADPVSEEWLPLGFDLDRYKFALLVHRMLFGGGVSGRPTADVSITAKDLSPSGRAEVARRLESLMRRAAGGSTGSRPPLGEWLEVLARIQSAT